MSGSTGDSVYEGSGGRSAIVEAFARTVMLAMAAIIVSSYRVAHEGESLVRMQEKEEELRSCREEVKTSD